MPTNPHAGSGAEPAPIVFHCTACGMRLRVAAQMAGVAGPCPGCGTLISAPAAKPAAPVKPAPQVAPTAPKRTPQARTHRGRIRGDTILDHAHLENRESIQSLKVLALFFLTFCICLAVIWLLTR